MKKIYKTMILTILSLSLLTLVGCSNKLTPEEKKAQEELRKEYSMIGKTFIEESLQEKYNDEFEVLSVNVLQYHDTLFSLPTGKYTQTMTAKVESNGKRFEVYANIDPENRYCADNYQKNEIKEDFTEYINSFYDVAPYATYERIFKSIGPFDGAYGMNSEYYDGNIEKYLENRGEALSVVLFYNNLDSFEITDKMNHALNTKGNFYIINAYKNSLKNKDAESIIYSYKINDYAPYIKEYFYFKNGESKYVENDLISIKSIMIEKNLGLNENDIFPADIDFDKNLWKKEIVEHMSKVSRVSDWFIQKDYDIYFNTSFIKGFNNSKKSYVIFTAYKDSNGEFVYSADYLYKHNIAGEYMIIEPNRNYPESYRAIFEINF